MELVWANMPPRNKIINNINTKWQYLKCSHFLGLWYAQGILLPHNVILNSFQQEANKIQLKIINGDIEFEFLMSMAYHIVTR
jgi:hypothetical protein